MTDYSDSFNFAIQAVLEEEGGEVNDPRDPGGHTKFGISQRQYPYLDIHTLTQDHAIEIYHLDYWQAVSGDDLPKPLGLCILDSAVNQGVGKAIRLLQSSIGADVDGEIGPQTRTLIRQTPVVDLVDKFMAERAISYAGTQNFGAFGKGWMRRLMRIHAKASRIT